MVYGSGTGCKLDVSVSKEIAESGETSFMRPTKKSPCSREFAWCLAPEYLIFSDDFCDLGMMSHQSISACPGTLQVRGQLLWEFNTP
jgi:hypothetical protein